MSSVENVASDLSPETSAVLVLENERPEWDFLAGVRRVATGRLQPATALVISNQRFNNPAGSGVLVTVEALMIATTVTGQVSIGTISGAADLANSVNLALLDTRFAVARQSSLTSSRDNAAAHASNAGIWTNMCIANQPVEIPTRALPILAPGTGFEITTVDINNGLVVGIAARERPIGKYERAINA